LKGIVPVIAALMLTSGCGMPGLAAPTLQWVKAGATKSDFDRDRCACALEAQAQFTKASSGADSEAAMSGGQKDNQDGLSICMNAHGWTLARQRGFQYPEDCSLVPTSAR